MPKRLTTVVFINRAKSIYGDKYDYSKVEYKNSQTKVTIICPKHGEFKITPDNFLNKHECPSCTKRSSVLDFVEKGKLVHNNKYDYSKVNYKNGRTKVTISCPIHGDFKQTPINHIAGSGCPHCALDSRKLGKDDFIKKAIEVHKNKYDYSKVEYKNNRTKVCIICPEHGEFWQIPSDHLRGIGCSKCNSSHLEIEVRNILISNSIKFEEQKTWNWLVYKSNLYVDFYLPDYNIVIECQGIQHFEAIGFFGGQEELNYTKERDAQKQRLCTENNLKVLYYTNLGLDYQYPYDIICNIEDLINEIKKIGLTNQS